MAHSSSGLGRSPLKAKTGVRVPYVLPEKNCVNSFLYLIIKNRKAILSNP